MAGYGTKQRPRSLNVSKYALSCFLQIEERRALASTDELSVGDFDNNDTIFSPGALSDPERRMRRPFLDVHGDFGTSSHLLEPEAGSAQKLCA
jgi:hypothetical protein